MPSNDAAALKQAITLATDQLLEQQHQDGYWVGTLESDVSVTAGYLPFMRYLGLRFPDRERKAVRHLRDTQAPDGGWINHPGGASSLDVSIQAYLSLKIAGCSSDDPLLQRARRFILSRGGIAAANTFTKIMLALFGQFDYAELPTLPPELILLPNWSPVTIYEFSSWARATIVALSIILTLQPVCPLPTESGVRELFVSGPAPRRNPAYGLFSWERFFLAADSILKLRERSPWKPLRRRALAEAERWIVSHQEADGSWGGIMLPWLYSLVALNTLGYANDHPVMAQALAGLEHFLIEDEDTILLQPAMSPVWDTAYVTLALSEAGLEPEHPALVQAAQWLLDRQVLEAGDWQIKRPKTTPGAWSFEFHNKFYPDVDDSTLVSMALHRVNIPDTARKLQAVDRAVNWILDMQGRSGGWAAFDVDNDLEMLAHIPFADFMTPLDPVSVDLTAHVVELLAELPPSRHNGALPRALGYIYREQQQDGAWRGRWGVNAVYGTAAALMGLAAAGEDMRHPRVRRAVSWLVDHQNTDGGWGESCRSYENVRLQGVGDSTASQTAWAILGLLGAAEAGSSTIDKGVSYLLRTQSNDGRWHEEAFTGTGFPRAFYLRYHMYPQYFPLLALARYQKALKTRRE